MATTPVYVVSNQDANGVGAIQLDGQMIDKPVYQRALDLTGRS